jgi:hypothetical protein
MATLGNVPAEAYTNTVKDSFSGNGSATAFTMSLPTVTNDVRVVVENVIQDPTVAYSVSGTTLTFTSAPPSGTNNIYVVHLGPAVMTTVPPAEIADATTFASSLTVQGAFTSKGIDDNADAVALTIDSSENVFVGKTSAGLSTAGVQLDATGSGGFCRAETCLTLSRLSTDGSILDFRKDSTTVGSIQSRAGSMTSLVLNPSGSDGAGFTGGSNAILPVSASALVDNTIDLGVGSYRYNDLFLGGGVYLGGTGSANKLDDYEYGSWTPTSDNAGSVTPNNAVYTKIGDQVTVWCLLTDFTDRSTATSLTVKGLPFNSTNGGVAVGSCMCQYVANTAHTIYMTGSSGLQFYKSENGSGFVVLNHSDLQNSAAQIYLMATYTAA